MTKLELMQLSQGLSNLYTGLETDLMANIGDFLAKGDLYSSTAQWKIQMLSQLGSLNKTNIKTIANYVGYAPSLLAQALEIASLTAIQDFELGFQKLAADGIIKDTDVPVEKTMENALKSYNKQAKNSLNMVNTVMAFKAKNIAGKLINDIADRQNKLDILNKSAGKVITGIESRQEAMRQCIKEMSESGIPAFVDKLGREWSPEAYINMDIRTTCSNVAHQSQMDRMDDYGIDLIEVSSHSGARPKCAKYQGRIFDRSNKSEKYPHWKDTSYGEPDGLLGINCGHQIYPFVEEISIQRYFPYDEKENDKKYKEIQKQRELERRVRKSKRECMILEKVGDQKGLARASATLKNRQLALKQYCADTGLSYKFDRTAVVGYNKTLSNKVKKSSLFINQSNLARSDETFHIIPPFKGDAIKPQSIYKALQKSKIGKDTYRYIVDNNIFVEINYTDECPKNIRGYTTGDSIIIFAQNTKTISITTQTLIHECTHSKYKIGGNQWAEAQCFSAELLHEKNELTISDMRVIIKKVKELYPEYQWRRKNEN